MEFRLVLEEDEETIGNYNTKEIPSLVSLLRRSRIVGFEGDTWISGAHSSLYFNLFPPYFFLTLEREP